MTGETPATRAPSPDKVLPEGAAVRFDDGAVRVSLARTLYRIEAILRSCYWLTDRCYVYLSPGDTDVTDVTVLAKSGQPAETNQHVWEFLEDLVDQSLRIQINEETRAVRELIVGQAFADVDMIDDRGRLVGPDEDTEATDGQGTPGWRPVR